MHCHFIAENTCITIDRKIKKSLIFWVNSPFLTMLGTSFVLKKEIESSVSFDEISKDLPHRIIQIKDWMQKVSP